MFIGNKIVQKMYRQNKIHQEVRFQQYQKIVLENVAKLSGFMEISEVKFPAVLKSSDKAVERASRAYKAL